MNMLKALLLTMRPKQWFKSFYLAFGAVPAVFLMSADFPLITLMLSLGIINLIMMQGVTYAINDIADYGQDRQHPKKRYRPIASGALSKRKAAVFAVLMLAGALALAYYLGIMIILIDLFLFANSVAYNRKPLKLRNRKWVDVFSTALNFPLRAMAGWYLLEPFNQARFSMNFNLISTAMPSNSMQSVLFNSSPRILDFSARFSTVTLSAISMIVFTYFLACFLLFLKRFAEKNAGINASHRASLAGYSPGGLKVSAKISAILTIAAAVVLAWSLKPPLLIIIPIFIYALMTYYNLAKMKNSPVAYPEEVFTKSKRFLLFGSALLILGLVILFA